MVLLSACGLLNQVKLALSTSLGASRPLGGFVGALDGYATNALGLWSISKRLLSSYTGALIRVRRGSDNAEQDIGFDAAGNLDGPALTAFVGGGSWFFRWIYDETGNGYHIGNATAAAQPQGALDGNGLAYAYAPGAGFTTTTLVRTGLAIAVTDTTHWTVHSAPGQTDLVMLRTSTGPERRLLNIGSIFLPQLPTSGTEGTLTGTNTGLYTTTMQVHGSGHRVSNGLAAATGTKPSNSVTIAQVGVGNGGGGAFWTQNAKFYAGGLWSANLGNTNADAVNAIGKTLFVTQ